VSLVRTMLAAVAEGRLDDARELMDPAFEMLQLPLHPEAGTYRGAKATESMETWVESFEEFAWEAEDLIDAGDRVVAVIRESGRGRGSGVVLDHRYGAVYTIRDGKVARLQWFHDKEQALESVGLREESGT
jgi:ketosteroid isomerase-like protein